MGLIHPADVGN